MKNCIVIVMILFMACNMGEQPDPEPDYPHGYNIAPIPGEGKQVKYQSDSTWEENGELVYRAKYARSPDDTIHLGRFNWDAIEIDEHGCLSITRFVSPDEIRIAWDSAVKVQKKNPELRLKGVYMKLPEDTIHLNLKVIGGTHSTGYGISKDSYSYEQIKKAWKKQKIK